jgi:riboflavin synthase
MSMASGTVVSLRPDGDSLRIEFAGAGALAGYLAPKGSITIDGVSLTVNEVSDVAGAVRFTVNIIPHTAAMTTLGTLAEGSSVNLEIDVLARYLGRMEALRHVAQA